MIFHTTIKCFKIFLENIEIGEESVIVFNLKFGKDAHWKIKLTCKLQYTIAYSISWREWCARYTIRRIIDSAAVLKVGSEFCNWEETKVGYSSPTFETFYEVTAVLFWDIKY